MRTKNVDKSRGEKALSNKYSVHVYIQIHMYKQYIDVITNIDKLHNRHVQKVLHHLDLLKYDKHIYVHSIHFDTCRQTSSIIKRKQVIHT